MALTKVTVAIPTFNRASLLKVSLQSVLAQDYPDFRVLVLDNASTDETESIVRSFADERIVYVRNESNVGLFRNWNRGLALNTSPYVSILQDDDILLPGFIRQSVSALEQHTGAALSVARVRGIDINGVVIDLPESVPPEGVMGGLDYLHGFVAGRHWVIHASSVMMRHSALEAVGPFDNPHSKHSIDLNLYLRLAARFDIAFIGEELAQVRFHPNQDTNLRFHASGTGMLAVMAERTDALGYLLRSTRGSAASYRAWLGERLLHTSLRRSSFTQLIVPDLNLATADRQQVVKQELEKLIPGDRRFILVDDGEWGSDVLTGRIPTPFVERDGRYWGPPPDNETAIREFERLWKSGASFIVFGWPAFWWLDYYDEFRDYLYSRFPCVLKNSRLVAFDLES